MIPFQIQYRDCIIDFLLFQLFCEIEQRTTLLVINEKNVGFSIVLANIESHSKLNYYLLKLKLRKYDFQEFSISMEFNTQKKTKLMYTK